MIRLSHHFPRIGMRIIKTSLAVCFCALLYRILGYEDLPFYLIISAMQGMQHYRGEARSAIIKNLQGTFIGAGCAFAIVLLQYFVLDPYDVHFAVYCVLLALGVLVTLYTAIVLNCTDNAYSSVVVFICIVSVHLGNESPYIYVLQRVVETLLGFAIGMTINAIHLPRRKDKDTLFVASLDDVLHSEFSQIPQYSKVELNRLLDDGISLSVMTKHTASSFLEMASDLRFELPVILNDGAVLYDPVNNSYLAKCEIAYEEAMELTRVLEGMGLDVVKATLAEDTPLNFYDRVPESTAEIYAQLHRSPYRNFIHRELPKDTPVVYLMVLDEKEKVRQAYEQLLYAGYDKDYKLSLNYAPEHPGSAYMRVYHKDADRYKMLYKLLEISGREKLRTYGNDPRQYDVSVQAAEGESIIRALKRDFEPPIWKKVKKEN